MEKTLKAFLEDLAREIRDTPTPKDMTWEEKVGFIIAREKFADYIGRQYANL